MSSLKQESKKDFFENPFNNDDIDLTEVFNTVIRKNSCCINSFNCWIFWCILFINT